MTARLIRRLVLAAVLAAGAAAPGVRAQAPGNEAEAKARFTVTLARFVQWPARTFASDNVPLRLCVLHNSPAVAAAFGAQQGVIVAGHPLNVSMGGPSAGAGCDLLFVDGSAARSFADGLPPPGAAPLLTIGALDGFLSRGGMVELVNVDDVLRFDVSLKTLRAAQLGLPGQVLRLAGCSAAG